MLSVPLLVCRPPACRLRLSCAVRLPVALVPLSCSEPPTLAGGVHSSLSILAHCSPSCVTRLPWPAASSSWCQKSHCVQEMPASAQNPRANAGCVSAPCCPYYNIRNTREKEQTRCAHEPHERARHPAPLSADARLASDGGRRVWRPVVAGWFCEAGVSG